MQLDYFVLFFTMLGSLIVGTCSVLMVQGRYQRLILAAFLLGFFFYNGVSIAYRDMPLNYLWNYFLFYTAFAAGYAVFSRLFARVSYRAGLVLKKTLVGIDSSKGWAVVIWVYLLLHLVPLVYPEVRLYLLFNPPLPDLTTAFISRFEPVEVDAFLRIVSYIRLSLEPFFFIALFRYRKRFLRVALILVLLLYIRHVDAGYIGRGQILTTLAMICIYLWEMRPKIRLALLVAVITALPFFMLAYHTYGVVRIGGTVSEVDAGQVTRDALELETSFLRSVGMPVIESGVRVDLGDYAKWILTLPVPKILTGEIESARINYEISEFFLGTRPGERGWYVALSGLLAESVYIFGNYLFWLHAVFLALIAALMGRLLERSPQMLFLKIHLLLLISFALNRAGIAALLPAITNNFLVFYIFIIASAFGFFNLFLKRSRGSYRVSGNTLTTGVHPPLSTYKQKEGEPF